MARREPIIAQSQGVASFVFEVELEDKVDFVGRVARERLGILKQSLGGDGYAYGLCGWLAFVCFLGWHNYSN